MQNLHLLEFLAKVFQCHVHHFQCLAVPVQLAAMKLLFRFMVVGMAGVCDCVKDCMSFVMQLIPIKILNDQLKIK